jgi:phosphatidylserine/phosphatidylglycerophosphate/cardiolipin synthase-like enzyme
VPWQRPGRTGVDVRITMSADPEWGSAFTQLAPWCLCPALRRQQQCPVIHAKAVVADAGLAGQQVLVGSQNFSLASLGYNDGLGIRTGARLSWP